jgi:hypothetical protein
MTDDGMRPDEAKYAAELGEDALLRQRQERENRCVLCWAPNGEPHAATCPNRPEDEPALLPSQDEALF